MADMHEQRGSRIDEYVEALVPADGQAGAAFAIHGWLIGFDPSDAGDTLWRLFATLVHSFALDAIDRPEGLDRVEAQATEVESFLAEVGRTSADSFPATGIGEDLRFGGDARAPLSSQTATSCT